MVWGNRGGGASQKAWYASNYRNTAVDNQGGSDVEAAGGWIVADLKICYCYPASCTANGGGPAYTNIGSVTRGNVGLISNGVAESVSQYLPGVADHNVDLGKVSFGSTPARERRALFRDSDFLDWRPRVGGPLVDAGADSATPTPGAPQTIGAAPDVGAYEHGESAYWIPGVQYAEASTPVPPVGAAGVLPDADLMCVPPPRLLHFLPGRNKRLRTHSLAQPRYLFARSQVPAGRLRRVAWRLPGAGGRYARARGSARGRGQYFHSGCPPPPWFKLHVARRRAQY